MTRRATVLASDVEWVVTTLSDDLDRYENQGVPVVDHGFDKVGELPRPPAFAANRRQLIEDINEFLTERMRHG